MYSALISEMSLRLSSERDQLLDTGTLGRQDLLLDTAYRHYTSPQGRLSGHGDTLAHLAPRIGRNDRGDHRDTRRRTVLGNGSLRYVDVDVVLLEHFGIDTQLLVVRHHPLVGDRRRLLHHLTQVTRQAHFALAGGQHRLDVEDIAADLGPSQAGDYADHIPRPRTLRAGISGCRESSRHRPA